MLTKPIREQSPHFQQNLNGQNQNEFSNNSLAVHKQAFYSIAKIIAALTVNNQVEGQLVIEQFIKDIKVKFNSTDKLKSH